MYTVNDILRVKGAEVITVQETDTVLHTLGVMAEHDVGAVVVLDEEHLAGIFSERDYSRKVVLMGRASRDMPVSEIMTGKPFCVRPSAAIHDCMAFMTERRTRYLPVVSKNDLVGLVSIGDLVKAVMEEQQFTITQLQEYIAG